MNKAIFLMVFCLFASLSFATEYGYFANSSKNMLFTNITASNFSTNYTLSIYAFINGTTDKSSEGNVYFVDVFPGTSVNYSKWSQSASGTNYTVVSGGKLTLGSSGSSAYNQLTMVQALPTNAFNCEINISAMTSPPPNTTTENQIQSGLVPVGAAQVYSNSSSQLRSYEGYRGFNDTYNYFTNQTTFAAGGELWTLSKLSETRYCINYNNINSVCGNVSIQYQNKTKLQHFQNSGSANDTYNSVVCYKYAATPITTTIGALETGVYNVNGSTYTKRVQINFTSSANFSNQPISLPSLLNYGTNFTFTTDVGWAYGILTVNSTVGGTAIGNNTTFVPPANLTINATANEDFMFSVWTITSGNCSVLNASNANTQVLVNNTSVCNAQANFFNYTLIVNVSMINSSLNDSTIFYNGTIYIWARAISSFGGPMNLTARLYYNGSAVYNITGFPVNSSTVYLVGTYNNASLVRKNSVWLVDITANNSYFESSKNSTAITISNTPPTTPTGLTLFTDTLNFEANGTGSVDIDPGDLVSYYYQFENSTSILRAYNMSNTFTCNATACPHALNMTIRIKAYDGTNFSAGIFNYTFPNTAFGPIQPTFAFIVAFGNRVYNLSESAMVSVSPSANISFYYLYRFYTWNNNTVQNYSTNNTYFIPSTFGQTRLFVDVIATNTTINTTAITNSSLVYSQKQTESLNLFNNVVGDFFNSNKEIIIGIFALAMGWGLTGSISITAMATGIIYIVAYIIMASTGLAYLGLALVILGLVLRYAGL